MPEHAPLEDVPQPEHTWVAYGLTDVEEVGFVDDELPDEVTTCRMPAAIGLSSIACAVCGAAAWDAEPACPGLPEDLAKSHRWVTLTTLGMDEQEAYAWARSRGEEVPMRTPKYIATICCYCGDREEDAAEECIKRQVWAHFGSTREDE